MNMEFWGLEVKAGAPIKVQPEEQKCVHISQAALGEVKKDSANENVVVYVKVGDQKLVVGTLNAERCAQIQYDLVFEKEFELSHNSKNASVHFLGYQAVLDDGDEMPYDDSESDDEDGPLELLDGPKKSEEKKEAVVPSSGNKAAPKAAASLEAKAKPDQQKGGKANAPVVVQDEDDDDDDEDDDDDDEDDEDDDSDDVAAGDMMDEDDDDDDNEDDDDEDEDDSEDEATPKKAENGKKRPAPALSTPAQKKAKVVSPAKAQKSGEDKKKGGHAATPHPAKQASKTAATPKSGSSLSCKSCSKTFGSENALQAHSKAKHGVGK